MVNIITIGVTTIIIIIDRSGRIREKNTYTKEEKNKSNIAVHKYYLGNENNTTKQ